MSQARQHTPYKSPQRKLVQFFEKSRNQWKTKYLETKAVMKRLQHRIRFLEKSREHWKKIAKDNARELAKMQRQERVREKKALIVKKKAIEVPPSPGNLEIFQRAVPYHTYALGHVMWFVSLVLSAATSLRCASRVMSISLSLFGLYWEVPSWHTGRLWLLRLGYHKLTRPKTQADDWVWILDHTVQLGQEKCLLIVGIRLRDVPFGDRSLCHEDLEPLTLIPVTKSNGEIVYQQLEDTIKITGIPRQIVSDHGSDIRSGIDRFAQKHEETCCIYDIKHKTAAMLKHEMKTDSMWQEFSQRATRSKQQMQQTAFAFLAPPNQRSKARYMNIDVLVHWGRDALKVLDRQPTAMADDPDQVRLGEVLGWLKDFRTPLEAWEELLEVIEVSESFVRKRGVYRGASHALKKMLAPLAYQKRTKRVCQELVAFVAEESMKARSQERLVGSSEVIESILGTLKRIEHDQAKSGFTGLVLSVAAMVAPTTLEVVSQALENVSTKKVLAWCKEKIGKSLQAKRKEAFASPKKAEQKPDRKRDAA